LREFYKEVHGEGPENINVVTRLQEKTLYEGTLLYQGFTINILCITTREVFDILSSGHPNMLLIHRHMSCGYFLAAGNAKKPA
jgi:hypothetical protein